MKTFLLTLCFLLIFQWTFSQDQTWEKSFLTTPEKTNYRQTSTYREVMDLIDQLKEKSDFLNTFSMGKSLEGKDIPVVILADPAVKTSEEAKRSGKPVIYIQGNIHAGEVEGKEVLQILMREILLGDKRHLLKNQILLFAPIYNTDSNDKMEAGRRPSQEDSPLKVGIRANSQGLDLNRDGIKMEGKETEGLFQNVITQWDPQVFVDLHTTNGTWHGYSLTWAPSYHYAGEKGPYHLTNNQLIPEVTKKVKEKYNIHIGPYGSYSTRQGWPLKAVYTYNHHPRYLVNQFGLRNRIGILSEAFAHERFYQRINSTQAFVTEILEYTNTNAEKIKETNKKAEENAIRFVKENSGKAKKGVRFKMVPLKEKLSSYRTYDYIKVNNADGKSSYLRRPNITTYGNIDYYAAFEQVTESVVPRGYIIPGEFSSVVEHLRKHGVKVESLSGPVKVSGEVFKVKSYHNSERKFEGHHMVQVEGEFKPQSKVFKKGAYKVDLAQPLANLIFYMLEPQSDDGLVTWNFFDEYFKNKGVDKKVVDYPIFKFFKEK